MSTNHIDVVLVHGAWADGSSWSKVIGPLKADGINVVAAPLPLTSLADDVAAPGRPAAGTDHCDRHAERERLRGRAQ